MYNCTAVLKLSPHQAFSLLTHLCTTMLVHEVILTPIGTLHSLLHMPLCAFTCHIEHPCTIPNMGMTVDTFTFQVKIFSLVTGSMIDCKIDVKMENLIFDVRVWWRHYLCSKQLPSH